MEVATPIWNGGTTVAATDCSDVSSAPKPKAHRTAAMSSPGTAGQRASTAIATARQANSGKTTALSPYRSWAGPTMNRERTSTTA